MSTLIPPQVGRWIYASVAKHFEDRIKDVRLHVEGEKRETEDETEWFEVRVDGPYYDEITNGQFRVECEVNVAVCVIQGRDHYRIHTLAGRAANTLSYCIDVYRYGRLEDDPRNDGSQLGCLTLLPKERYDRRTSFFGQVRSDANLYQASVEAHYRMFCRFTNCDSE